MSAEPREGIVVLGTPRSGTTLLRRLLDAHPEIACPGETNLFSACARFLVSERIAEGVDIGVLAGLGYAGFEESEVLGRLRELAFGFHRDHAARAGKPRWAEKTAFDAFHLEPVERLCGDAVHYVCVVRHGLDVVCSLQELSAKNERYLAELHAYVVRHPNFLEAFAHAWVDLTTALLDFADRREDAVLVRYEDLVEDPAREMDRVGACVGATWSEDLVSAAMQRKGGVGLGDWKTYGRQTIDRSSVGRWSGLSKHTVAGLARIVNATLERAGYDAVDTGAERDDEEARRRYALGLLVGSLKSD